MWSTDSDESLQADCNGHVGGQAEGHRGHGVEDVHVQIREESGLSEQLTDKLEGGVGMYWNIEHDVSRQNTISSGVYCQNPKSTTTVWTHKDEITRKNMTRKKSQGKPNPT